MVARRSGTRCLLLSKPVRDLSWRGGKGGVAAPSLIAFSLFHLVFYIPWKDEEELQLKADEQVV